MRIVRGEARSGQAEGHRFETKQSPEFDRSACPPTCERRHGMVRPGVSKVNSHDSACNSAEECWGLLATSDLRLAWAQMMQVQVIARLG